MHQSWSGFMAAGFSRESIYCVQCVCRFLEKRAFRMKSLLANTVTLVRSLKPKEIDGRCSRSQLRTSAPKIIFRRFLLQLLAAEPASLYFAQVRRYSGIYYAKADQCTADFVSSRSRHRFGLFFKAQGLADGSRADQAALWICKLSKTDKNFDHHSPPFYRIVRTTSLMFRMGRPYVLRRSQLKSTSCFRLKAVA